MKKLILSALIATTLVGCGGSKKNDNVDPEPALQNHQGVFVNANFNSADKNAPEFVKLSVTGYKVGFLEENTEKISEQNKPEDKGTTRTAQVELTGKPVVNVHIHTLDNEKGNLIDTEEYKLNANIEKDILTLTNPEKSGDNIKAQRLEQHWQHGSFTINGNDFEISDQGGVTMIKFAGMMESIQEVTKNVYVREVSAKEIRSLNILDSVPDNAQLNLVFTMFKIDTTAQLLLSVHALDTKENIATLYGPEKTTP